MQSLIRITGLRLFTTSASRPYTTSKTTIWSFHSRFCLYWCSSKTTTPQRTWGFTKALALHPAHRYSQYLRPSTGYYRTTSLSLTMVFGPESLQPVYCEDRAAEQRTERLPPHMEHPKRPGLPARGLSLPGFRPIGISEEPHPRPGKRRVRMQRTFNCSIHAQIRHSSIERVIYNGRIARQWTVYIAYSSRTRACKYLPYKG